MPQSTGNMASMSIDHVEGYVELVTQLNMQLLACQMGDAQQVLQNSKARLA